MRMPCRLTLLLVLAAASSGCSSVEPWVKPYERQYFADIIMSAERDPVAAAYLNHVFEAREGAREAVRGEIDGPPGLPRHPQPELVEPEAQGAPLGILEPVGALDHADRGPELPDDALACGSRLNLQGDLPDFERHGHALYRRHAGDACSEFRRTSIAWIGSAADATRLASRTSARRASFRSLNGAGTEPRRIRAMHGAHVWPMTRRRAHNPGLIRQEAVLPGRAGWFPPGFNRVFQSLVGSTVSFRLVG